MNALDRDRMYANADKAKRHGWGNWGYTPSGLLVRRTFDIRRDPTFGWVKRTVTLLCAWDGKVTVRDRWDSDCIPHTRLP